MSSRTADDAARSDDWHRPAILGSRLLARSDGDSTLRFVTVVGARPQFIKAAPLSAELRLEHEEFLVHTGQHYDDNMSAVFFRELAIPSPDRHLDVGSGSHGWQTAAMLERLERVFEEYGPDAVVVFGDTNSTLAGALAAAKMQIPVAHVEAGLRSHNRDMPEETNRVLTDHLSHLLFAPSKMAVDQLAAEGIHRGVYSVGDIMADCVRLFSPHANKRSKVIERFGLCRREYALATVHRAGNTDTRDKLAAILDGLNSLPYPVVLALHPRTEAAMKRHDLDKAANGSGQGQLLIVEPCSYLDMLQLAQNARLVLTDSGGLQKEAYYLGVPCVTLRDETEWGETIHAGWNRLAGADPARIVSAAEDALGQRRKERPTLYGDGHTASRIVGALESNLS